MFDFELADSSLEGEKNGPQAAEQARLLRISEQVRKGMAESGKFAIVDIRPVVTAAHNSNLQACGGCDVDLAKQLDADLAVTGVVHKISTLILSMIIYVRDARTGQLVTAASADFRGDTDESWSRTASFLLRNRVARAQLRGSALGRYAEVSSFSARGVPAQMVVHEAGDEIVAVVITRLAAQRQRGYWLWRTPVPAVRGATAW